MQSQNVVEDNARSRVMAVELKIAEAKNAIEKKDFATAKNCFDSIRSILKLTAFEYQIYEAVSEC